MEFLKIGKRRAYNLISSEKDCEDHQVLLKHNQGRDVPRQIRFLLPWSLFLFSFLANLLQLIQNFNLTSSQHLSSELATLDSTPIDEHVVNTWQKTRFNGSFAKLTIYRQSASPEVDRAWDDLGVQPRFLRIEPEKAERYGLHPGQVKLTKENGGGVVANVEVFHQPHCLNLMRKGSHWDFQYYWNKEHEENADGVFSGDSDSIRLHFSHCLDMLRQSLMCISDTRVIGQVWVNETRPMIDFSTEHKCRNFDAIKKWADEHSVAAGSSSATVKFQPGDEIFSESS